MAAAGLVAPTLSQVADAAVLACKASARVPDQAPSYGVA